MSSDEEEQSNCFRVKKPKKHQKYFNFIDGQPVVVIDKQIVYLAQPKINIKRYYSKITDPDHQFQQFPNTKKEREILYVSGPSGSGKSYYIKQYAKILKHIFPKKPIYLFSKLTEDVSLDDIKGLKRIALDDAYLDNPLEPKIFTNSMVIFDDIFALNNKALRESIFGLMDDISVIGRHHNVTLAVTSHLMTNYKETRHILNEAHFITFFPSAGGVKSIRYTLKEYCGLDNKTIQRILKLDSRWITISKNYPQYIIWEHGLSLLNDF